MSKERNLRYIKNVIQSSIFLSISSALIYVMVPIELNYLGPERYGLWAVLGSVFMWLGVFNLGFGSGLRYHLSSSVAKGEISLAQQYVSTTYAVFSIIGIVFLFFFIAVYRFVNWSILFNAPASLAKEMNITVGIMAVFFAVNSVLALINTVFIAFQKNRVADFFTLITNILRLTMLLLISRNCISSLIIYFLAMQVPLIIIELIISSIGFTREYKNIRPSFSKISFEVLKGYSGISAKFLLLQIAVLFVLVTNNILITHLLGPEKVAEYNIALQYISIGTFFFRMLITPSESAMIEAHSVNDNIWIRRTLSLFIKAWLVLVVCLTIMVLVSPYVYSVWIGNKINIATKLTFFIMISQAMSYWCSLFSSHILGTGKLKMTISSSILLIVTHVLFSIFFVRYLHMGVEGIALSLILSSLFPFITMPIQSYLIIKGKAHGVWGS